MLAVSTSCTYLDQWDDNDDHNQEEEVISDEPFQLEDEISDENIGRLPAKEDGPHILKRDGKYWIIAEPSAQLANVLSSMNSNHKGINYEPSPAYLRLARELNYRINEMCFNTQATTEDYKELYVKTLTTLEKIAVAEAENNSYIECIKTCIKNGQYEKNSVQDIVDDKEAEEYGQISSEQDAKVEDK